MDDINSIGAATLEEPQQEANPVNQIAAATLDPPTKEDAQQHKLADATDYYRRNAADFWGPGTQPYVNARIPLLAEQDSIEQADRVRESARAMKEGWATDPHIYTLAQHQARSEYEAERAKSFGSKALDLATGLPKMAAEYMAGGALSEAALPELAAMRGLGGLAAREVGRAAFMPATYENMANRAAGGDSGGAAAVKGALDSTIQNVAMTVAGTFAPKVGGGYVAGAAVSAGKAIGGAQAAKEAVYQAALSGDPSEIHKIISGPNRIQAMKDLAPEILVFGSLEAAMHGLPIIAKQMAEAKAKGLNPDSAKVKDQVAATVDQLRQQPTPVPKPPPDVAAGQATQATIKSVTGQESPPVDHAAIEAQFEADQKDLEQAKSSDPHAKAKQDTIDTLVRAGISREEATKRTEESFANAPQIVFPTTGGLKLKTSPGLNAIDAEFTVAPSAAKEAPPTDQEALRTQIQADAKAGRPLDNDPAVIAGNKLAFGGYRPTMAKLIDGSVVELAKAGAFDGHFMQPGGGTVSADLIAEFLKRDGTSVWKRPTAAPEAPPAASEPVQQPETPQTAPARRLDALSDEEVASMAKRQGYSTKGDREAIIDRIEKNMGPKGFAAMEEAVKPVVPPVVPSVPPGTLEQTPVAKAFGETFPGARQTYSDESVTRWKAESGDQEIYARHDSETNKVRIDFGWQPGKEPEGVAKDGDKANVAKELQPGSLDLFRKIIRKFAGKLKEAGVGIEYTATDSRADTYRRRMEKAGFEQDKEPEEVSKGAGSSVYSWKPKAETPQPQSLLERMRAKQKDVATPTPPRPEMVSTDAHVDSIVKALGEYGDSPVERLRALFNSAGLTSGEMHALFEKANGRTFQDIASDPGVKGVSPQAIQKREARARAKVEAITGRPFESIFEAVNKPDVESNKQDAASLTNIGKDTKVAIEQTESTKSSGHTIEDPEDVFGDAWLKHFEELKSSSAYKRASKYDRERFLDDVAERYKAGLLPEEVPGALPTRAERAAAERGAGEQAPVRPEAPGGLQPRTAQRSEDQAEASQRSAQGSPTVAPAEGSEAAGNIVDTIESKLGDMIEDIYSGPYTANEQGRARQAWKTIRAAAARSGGSVADIIDADWLSKQSASSHDAANEAARTIADLHSTLQKRYGGWEPSESAGDKLSADHPLHPDNVAAQAKDILSIDKENAERHNRMLREARDGLKEFGGDYKLLHLERYEDANDVKGLDEVAEDMKAKHPEWFPDNQNADDVLFDILKKGNRKLLNNDQAMRQAENLAHGQANPEDIQETNSALKQSGLGGVTPADIREAERQAREQVAAKIGVDPEELGGIGDQSGDASFDFSRPVDQPASGAGQPPAGAIQAGNGSTGEPAGPGGSQGTGRPGTPGGPNGLSIPDAQANQKAAGQLIGNAFKEFVQGEAGTLDLQAMKERFGHAYNTAHDAIGRAAGYSAPATTRLSEPAGRAVWRMMSVKGNVESAQQYYPDAVLGRHSTDAQERLAGSVMMELRFRQAKDNQYRAAAEDMADARKAAAAGDLQAWQDYQNSAAKHIQAGKDTATAIGMKDSPLKTAADYTAALQDPFVQEAMKNYKAQYVDFKESAYRDSQGLEDTDPINSATQIKDMPIRAVPLDADGNPMGKGGPGAEGNLRNPKLRKNPSSYQATLAHDVYELNLRKIMEADIGSGVPLAAKANMYRALESEGLGEWRKPGESGPLANGKEATLLEDVNPPKNTQANDEGARNFYVDNDAAGEVRSALAVDKQPAFTKAVAMAMHLPGIAALASSVEMAAHGANLASSAFHRSDFRDIIRKPMDFFTNMHGFLTSDPKCLAKIRYMAETGRIKPGKDRPGLLVPNWLETLIPGLQAKDPTQYPGRVLHAYDEIVRATLSDGYDRAAARGHFVGSESDKTNFINSLAGNYHRNGMSSMVKFLKDSQLQPFATPAVGMTLRSIRGLVGGGPGKATSLASDVQLRASVIAQLVALPAAGMLANYLSTGKAMPDGIPYGSLYTGDDEKGQKKYMDLLQLVGLKRGLNALGVLPYAEAKRQGHSTGEAVDRGAQGAANSMLHTVFGPGPQFYFTALTGLDNPLGGKKVSKTADYEAGETQRGQDIKAAAQRANPVVSSLTGADEPTRETSKSEKAWKLLGPFNPQKTASVQAAPEVNLMHEALGHDMDVFKENATTQKRMGLRAKEPLGLVVLNEAQKRISDLDRRYNNPATDQATKQQIRQRQAAIATAALARRKALMEKQGK